VRSRARDVPSRPRAPRWRHLAWRDTDRLARRPREPSSRTAPQPRTIDRARASTARCTAACWAKAPARASVRRPRAPCRRVRADSSPAPRCNAPAPPRSSRPQPRSVRRPHHPRARPPAAH
jgi:hypothetical protein